MIQNINFIEYKKNNNKFIQNFFIDNNEKSKLGIVYTPFSLVEKIINMIPINYFNNNTKWLDIGSGLGNFSFIIYEKLLNNSNLNYNNIIKNLYFSEIQEDQIKYLKELFGKDINLFDNFFNISNNSNNFLEYFDVIIGNPPYNYGKIKTPTNSQINKKDEGKSIWQKFIIESLKLLKWGGFLSLIVPAIWLKPDKSGIYELLTSYKIIKLSCLSNNETNKEFNYKAQTPTCYFLIQKILSNNNNNNILIYDQLHKDYINYTLKKNYPIPMSNISIINKFLKKVNLLGTIKIHKTNCLPNKINLSTNENEFYKFQNISSCLLEGNQKLLPVLLKFYSDYSAPHYGIRKLILSHKMYGFPFLDDEGLYGISARDNYIIKDYSKEKLIKIGKFLSSKTIIFLYSSTAYRMKYLEKYIFYFIPDISNELIFDNLPDNILERDKIIQDYFHLSEKEREIINSSVKNYKFFL